MEVERIRLGPGVSIYREWLTWVLDVYISGRRLRKSLQVRDRYAALEKAVDVMRSFPKDEIFTAFVAEATGRFVADLVREEIPVAGAVVGSPVESVKLALREVLTERAPTAKLITIDVARDEYVDHQAGTEGNTKAWCDNIRRQVRMFTAWSKLTMIGEIEPRHISEYLAYVRIVEKRKDWALKQKLHVLRKFLDWAVKVAKYLPANPAADINVKKPGKIDVIVYSRDEAERILEKAAKLDANVAAAIALAFCAGLRRGEIMRLSWEHVDFKARLIRVANTTEAQTKTRRGRTVPIFDSLLPYLVKLQRDTGRLLPWRNSRTLSRLVTRACESAEISKGDRDGLQYGRHTFVTAALKAGVSALVVSTWSGHGIDVIEGHYAGKTLEEPLPLTYFGRRLVSQGLPQVSKAARAKS